jgi:hypothetical protein
VETYNLFRATVHPFHENMAPNLPSPHLNVHLHRSTFHVKWTNPTSCVHFIIDTQGEIAYIPSSKKRVLITSPHQDLEHHVGPCAGVPGQDAGGNVLGGSAILSPYLSGPHENEAYMISQLGGDLELIFGQDLSTGYEKHGQTSVTLYIAESFTFRILEPVEVIHYTAR